VRYHAGVVVDIRPSSPWFVAGIAVFAIQVALTLNQVIDHGRAVRCHDLANWYFSCASQGLAVLTAILLLAYCQTGRGGPLATAVVAFAAALVVEGARGASLCSLAPLGLAWSGTPNLLLGWLALARHLRLDRIWWIVPTPLLVFALLAYVWHLACL
jgi:hypothetical protein